MALWLVRAGARGEREQFALDNNVVVHGNRELPDLANIKSKEELKKMFERAYPDAKPATLSSWAAQLWAFISRIQIGDLVALPLKQRPEIAFGEVTGPYQFHPENPPDARHTRPVHWLKVIPRSNIDQDLLYSFGSSLTVCQIRRNNAEARIRALLEGKAPEEKIPDTASEDGESTPNLDELALDQIRTFVTQRFAGHRLTDLVSAVLTAQGYKVRQSPEGPDGGVDILAGSGPLGFDSPRIAVQVKSGATPVDVMTVQQLQGAIKSFKADYGLFVSWSGYKRSVLQKEAQLFFDIRLWDSDDLLREVFKHYDKLSDDLQAELPLKRIWVLVPSEETTS